MNYFIYTIAVLMGAAAVSFAYQGNWRAAGAWFFLGVANTFFAGLK